MNLGKPGCFFFYLWKATGLWNFTTMAHTASATLALVVLFTVTSTACGFANKGVPNCVGCFNATSGECILDTDPGGDPSCPLATPADCKAQGLPFLNTSLDTWVAPCCLLRACR